jgi:hypothetical protein
VTFSNAGNSFSGNGLGLTAAGLVRTTVLNVDCTAPLPSYSTAYTKVANIGTFNKLLAASTIEVTFNGRTYVNGMNMGASGARFELRVDDTATSNGRARAIYRSTETGTRIGVQTSITGVFNVPTTGIHTVSMWIQGVGSGGNGAQLDVECFQTDHVVIKEFK